MAWIESHQSLSRHAKLLTAMAMLRVDRHKLIGHLHELWWWGLDNTGRDGCIGRVSAEIIASAAEWKGNAERFVEVLLTCDPDGEEGFLERDDEGRLYFHNWARYAGKLLDQRERNRDRMRRARATDTTTADNARAPHVQDTLAARAPATVPYRTQPYPTNESTSENLSICGTGEPETKAADAAHIRSRKAKKKSGTPERASQIFEHYKAKVQPNAKDPATEKILARLEHFTPEELLAGIDHFAADGWEMEHNAHRGAVWFFAKDQRSEQYLNLKGQEVQSDDHGATVGSSRGGEGADGPGHRDDGPHLRVRREGCD